MASEKPIVVCADDLEYIPKARETLESVLSTIYRTNYIRYRYPFTAPQYDIR